MGDWTLRLTEDRFPARAWYGLPAAPRVLSVRSGDLVVTHGGTAERVVADTAWHGPGQCSATAERVAIVLRWELLPAGAEAAAEWPAVTSTRLLEHPVALDPAQPYLMRCDRVDFAPGGEARPHGHKGGGIRCLIAGALEVRVGGQPGRTMKPGDAWFESGVEPVHALASATEPTSFIRVSILPLAVRGQSSIVYVDPADAAVKPRSYRVFVDEPIELAT